MKNLLKPLLAVKSKKGYSILTAVMVTLFSAWVIYDATMVRVVLAADGEVQTVKAHMSTVGDLLEEVGIELGDHDYLSHDEATKLTEGMEVKYKTAHKITLTIDGETKIYYTIANKVDEFFESEGLEFTDHDDISYNGNQLNDSSLIEDNMDIVVNRAFKIKVVDGGKKKSYWTTNVTVEEFLKKNNIKLNKLDKLKPKLTDHIDENTKVSIIRVVQKEKEVEEIIQPEVEEKSDASLEKGKTKVIQEGKDGLAKRTYNITKENGKEVDRDLIKEEIIKKPVKRIVAVGTKEPQITLSGGSTPGGSGKVMIMEATGYGMDCSGCSGVTATGINVRSNPNIKVISVDPNVIPLGSRVWVEGYGEAIAGDTGGAIKGNRIDVLLPSEDYARKHWGRRTVKVKILD